MSVQSLWNDLGTAPAGAGPSSGKSLKIDGADMLWVERPVPLEAPSSSNRLAHSLPPAVFRERKALRESVFMVGSVGAACALIFLLVLCFRRSKSHFRKNRALIRRLAEGGADFPSESCAGDESDETPTASQALAATTLETYDAMRHRLEARITESALYEDRLRTKKELLVFQLAQKTQLEELLQFLKDFRTAQALDTEESAETEEDAPSELPQGLSSKFNEFLGLVRKTIAPVLPPRPDVPTSSLSGSSKKKSRKKSLRDQSSEVFGASSHRLGRREMTVEFEEETSSESDEEEEFDPVVESFKHAIFSSELHPDLLAVHLPTLSEEMARIGYDAVVNPPDIGTYTQYLRVFVRRVLMSTEPAVLSAGATRHRLIVCARVINSVVLFYCLGYRDFIREALEPVENLLPASMKATGRKKRDKAVMLEFLRKILLDYVKLSPDEISQEYLETHMHRWAADLTRVLIIVVMSGRPLTLTAHTSLIPRDRVLLQDQLEALVGSGMH